MIVGMITDYPHDYVHIKAIWLLIVHPYGGSSVCQAFLMICEHLFLFSYYQY